MNRNPKNAKRRKSDNRTRTQRTGKKRGGKPRFVPPAALIFTICVLAATLLAMRLLPRRAADVPAARELPTRSEVEAGTAALPRADEAAAPVITLAPQATAQPTAAPTQAPTPRPTVEPTPQPTAAPATTAFEYLPVAHRAEIKSRKIAITVDDCYQVTNLQAIVEAAEKAGGRLTLFPVGENLSKPGMSKLLKHCVFDLGFEIENHTWSHARIFRLPDDEMAGEIWKQDAALDQALGVDYQEHFLRLMGGDGDTDPRIHSYLKQLDYLGLANWSVSGSDSDLKHIKASLAPGQIYLFHCTDPDTKKLKEFIPWAVSQGYQLVTLNELFNLPDNETSPLTDRAMPRPESGVDDHHTLKEGEYTWVALQLQEKLRSLGYLVMDGPSTGYYGPQTVKAVAAFQKDHGLPVTGEADEETQRRLLEG